MTYADDWVTEWRGSLGITARFPNVRDPYRLVGLFTPRLALRRGVDLEQSVMLPWPKRAIICLAGEMELRQESDWVLHEVLHFAVSRRELNDLSPRHLLGDDRTELPRLLELAWRLPHNLMDRDDEELRDVSGCSLEQIVARRNMILNGTDFFCRRRQT